MKFKVLFTAEKNKFILLVVICSPQNVE